MIYVVKLEKFYGGGNPPPKEAKGDKMKTQETTQRLLESLKELEALLDANLSIAEGDNDLLDAILSIAEGDNDLLDAILSIAEGGNNV